MGLPSGPDLGTGKTSRAVGQGPRNLGIHRVHEKKLCNERVLVIGIVSRTNFVFFHSLFAESEWFFGTLEENLRYSQSQMTAYKKETPF